MRCLRLKIRIECWLCFTGWNASCARPPSRSLAAVRNWIKSAHPERNSQFLNSLTRKALAKGLARGWIVSPGPKRYRLTDLARTARRERNWNSDWKNRMVVGQSRKEMARVRKQCFYLLISLSFW